MYFESFDGEFHGMMDWFQMLPMWAWIGIGALVLAIGSIIIYSIVQNKHHGNQTSVQRLSAIQDQSTIEHSTTTNSIPIPAQPSGINRSYCPHCGRIVSPDTSFCPNCGASID